MEKRSGFMKMGGRQRKDKEGRVRNIIKVCIYTYIREVYNEINNENIRPKLAFATFSFVL